MKRKVLVRIGHAVLSVILLTVFVFAMVRLTGDPASMLLPDTATQADVERLRARLGLDQPIPVQYAIYLGDLVRGDFEFQVADDGPCSIVTVWNLGSLFDSGGDKQPR